MKVVAQAFALRNHLSIFTQKGMFHMHMQSLGSESLTIAAAQSDGAHAHKS